MERNRPALVQQQRARCFHRRADIDSFGDLYGPTAEGARYRGTVVRLKRPVTEGGKWTPTVLYTFRGIPDGGDPAASLIFDALGNLYGTTEDGGNSGGYGTVFEVSP